MKPISDNQSHIYHQKVKDNAFNNLILNSLLLLPDVKKGKFHDLVANQRLTGYLHIKNSL